MVEANAVFLAARQDDPHWDEAGKVHDWRNHVPESVRSMWRDLDYRGRCAVALMAMEAADAEEWD